MIQTLNPYDNATTRAKTTAEIMARYRPIAPKPTEDQTSGGVGGGGGITSEKIRQSPYLRSVWSHLQARPTRTRKRGRTSYPLLAPPSSSATKRVRAQCCLHGATNPSIPHQQFCSIPSFATARAAAIVTLPLLPPPCINEDPTSDVKMMIDLNKFSGAGEEASSDGLIIAQPTAAAACNNVVISPRPIRLVGSSISIRAIRDEPMQQLLVKVADADEVEQELDSEALPAIVSDSKNKVRLVNSAYKEMVGQPLCPWLDSVQSAAAACDNRICGEVMLHLFGDEEADGEDPAHHPLLSSEGFSCLAKIEWGTNGAVHDVFCQAMRLFCESKDYMFAWRFHT